MGNVGVWVHLIPERDVVCVLPPELGLVPLSLFVVSVLLYIPGACGCECWCADLRSNVCGPICVAQAKHP